MRVEEVRVEEVREAAVWPDDVRLDSFREDAAVRDERRRAGFFSASPASECSAVLRDVRRLVGFISAASAAVLFSAVTDFFSAGICHLTFLYTGYAKKLFGMS